MAPKRLKFVLLGKQMPMKCFKVGPQGLLSFLRDVNRKLLNPDLNPKKHLPVCKDRDFSRAGWLRALVLLFSVRDLESCVCVHFQVRKNH